MIADRKRIAGRIGAVSPWAILAAVCFAASTAGGAQFTLQVLPGDRSKDTTVWRDVNGDGRKDFIRQADRRIDVYLLEAGHRLRKSPDWTVRIEPPWDLWDFADVRPDVPGEELLALSPRGVGWASFQNRTSSTARMDSLIAVDLPLKGDDRMARPGRYAVQLSPDRPADLLLPTRSGMQIHRRKPESNAWEVVEELAAPVRPSPWFRARSSLPYLVGYGRRQSLPGLQALSPTELPSTRSRGYRFNSRWSASGGWLTDWNGDGRLDWVESKRDRPDRVRIYLQTPQGRFDRGNPVLPPRVKPTEEEDEKARSVATFFARPDEIETGHSRGLSFEDLADVDGDGDLDLVRISAFENWAMPKTRVAVYLQTKACTYPDKPDSLLRLGAVVPTDGLPLSDVDGDGDLDLLLLRIDLEMASVNSQLKAFMRKGIDTYLGTYLWKRGGYSKRPAREKLVVVGHELFELTRDPRPLMQFDRDLTGDGSPDLVLRLTRDTAGVFAPRSPKEGFPGKATAVLKPPFTIDSVECDDLDGDGRIDVLVGGWDADARERMPQAVFFNEMPAPKSKGAGR